jgi:hypothetical protein
MKKNKKITALFVMISLFLASCGGESADAENAGDGASDTTQTVVAAAPVTTTSGSSVELIKEAVDPKSVYDNGYNFLYTVVDYTTNTPTKDLPIDEFTGPSETEQLLKLRLSINAVSLVNLTCKEPLDGDNISLFITEDGEKIQSFSRFSADFKAKLDGICLEAGATQEMDVYYKIPANADLSKARLSIYRGSSEEALVFPLNK